MIEVVINDKKLLFIRMSVSTALRTIESLSEQIRTNNPNTGRWEEYTKEGQDFSISVDSSTTNEEQ